MAKFPLNPTKKNILVGRHMNLVCAAPICLHALKYKDDPNYNDPKFQRWIREINVIGTATCMVCKTTLPYTDFFVYDEMKILAAYKESVSNFVSLENSVSKKCPHCGSDQISGTTFQEVYSKHHRSSHLYYHAECMANMAIGGDDEEEEETISIPRLNQKTSQVEETPHEDWFMQEIPT